MSQLFEAAMVLSFGISWPASIAKSYTSRTAKGKSIFFLGMILLGYACGIISKLSTGNITYVFIFYVINFAMVATDIVLYFRNKRIDAAACSKIKDFELQEVK
jgi:hypothetical protein